MCMLFPMWLEYKMRFSLRINILRFRSLCTHISLRSSYLPYPKLNAHTHTLPACWFTLYSRSQYNKNKRGKFSIHILIKCFHPCIYDYNVLQPVWFNFELKCSWRCSVPPHTTVSAMGNVRLWKGTLRIKIKKDSSFLLSLFRWTTVSSVKRVASKKILLIHQQMNM